MVGLGLEYRMSDSKSIVLSFPTCLSRVIPHIDFCCLIGYSNKDWIYSLPSNNQNVRRKYVKQWLLTEHQTMRTVVILRQEINQVISTIISDYYLDSTQTLVEGGKLRQSMMLFACNWRDIPGSPTAWQMESIQQSIRKNKIVQRGSEMAEQLPFLRSWAVMATCKCGNYLNIM